jgi:D-alanine-D-alanine ligase
MQTADVVFPVLHGVGGEDGAIQAYLEPHDITYVGSDAASSRLCIDKWATKELLRTNGILSPGGELVSADSIGQSQFIQQPFVLKPFDGGSSVDTIIVRDPKTINEDLIRSALERHQQMLIEQLVTGTEITVGVLGTEALPVIEIQPPSDGEFDYENKYNGATRELCPPETVSDSLQLEAQRIAEKAHQVCGCRDFSRTDMMISPDGTISVLEINTIPGMTNQSLFPKAAAVSGLDMPSVCAKLVRMALERKVS